tara:strand:+ start:1015 stop:1260 length:246 start_codon:yes stop_codon:yes gene_type:complete
MLTNLIYISIAAILIFVLYLAVKAITRGVEAKSDLKQEKDDEINLPNYGITNEISKLQKMYESGALTKDEFTKAKQKILDD